MMLSIVDMKNVKLLKSKSFSISYRVALGGELDRRALLLRLTPAVQFERPVHTLSLQPWPVVPAKESKRELS